MSAAPNNVPVVRVVFEERAFFDFNQDAPRPEAAPLFDIVAENMRRDVPDAQLTLLGHTDAIGTDAYNDDLSLRRARAVFEQLALRQVNPSQLSTVAIGRRQPIAPNSTDDGRARNRRVEFLISASFDANAAVIGQRAVPGAWLRVGPGQGIAPSTPSVLAVLRPEAKPVLAAAQPAKIDIVLKESGIVRLPPPTAEQAGALKAQQVIPVSPGRPVTPVRPAPAPTPERVPLAEPERVPLGPSVSY